jgi:threonine dehydrogenase-like Zn-dependent dehydrogenase
MSEGKLVADPMISHHFKLDQIHDAFDTYVNRVGNALKVAIQVGG